MEEVWFKVIVTLCLAALIKPLFNLIFPSKRNSVANLPPGPRSVPVIGKLLWLRKTFSDIEPIIRDLKSKYGPIITLSIGSRPAIFVCSHSLAHRFLVQNGVVFSDRPTPPPASRIFNSNQCNISSAGYGPNWRLFRRNLTSEILHPARIKSYSGARRWVLGILVQRLLEAGKNGGEGVTLVDHFQYSMFCLLVLMCFGDKLREDQIKAIETVQRRLLLRFSRFNVLSFFPRLSKFLFPGLWREVLQLRQDQDDVLIPLIKARIEAKSKQKEAENQGTRPNLDETLAYVDTVADLELPEQKRKVNYQEMVSLCSEFLNAGTDTTSTALQWIMANVVKFPHIQDKLYEEIVSVMGPPPPPLSLSSDIHDKCITEEDIQSMKYLKAVVLEALRRHPPGHFVLPHSVTEDVELEGYVIPKDATVNFTVADMGLDPKVWENPMEFIPERFINTKEPADGFDLTGSREIKMMPFGAGRRICPGFGLALLHLEYFVANLVWYFEWKAVEGVGVDLSEKQEFTVVMKNPLQAHISPRNQST